MREPAWSVVVPVKRIAIAKTRLRRDLGRLPPGRFRHDQLVLAMAQDTVRAMLACPVVTEVVVVTDDPEVSHPLGRLGARVVPDAPAAGLNAAIGHGAAQATGDWVAGATADLPALRPDELLAVLRTAGDAGRRGFVPDAAGTGTTLLTAPPGVAVDPQFGPDSAARHAASGASRLDGPWPSVRRDVDTAADLTEAERLGLGPSTACLVHEAAMP